MFTGRLYATLFLLALLGCNPANVSENPKTDLTKKPIATLDGNVALAFSPDGKWLAVGAELIDTSNWKVAAMLEPRVSDKNPISKNHWGYTSAAFSPDSKKLALGDQDGSLRILAVPSMELSQEFLAHGARLTGIGFGNDNETVVTTSVDDLIRLSIWNSRTEEVLFRSVDSEKVRDDKNGVMVDIVGAIDIFALSPDRESFAVADVMSKILIASVRDGKVLQEFKGPNADEVEMDSLAFSFDSRQLLVGVTPKVYVYDVNGTPTSVEIETKADMTPLYVKLINENGLIAMSYGDTDSKMPAIELYDLKQQKSLGSFFPHEMQGSYWAVSPDGQYIATTGRGGPVHIWNVAEAVRDFEQP